MRLHGLWTGEPQTTSWNVNDGLDPATCAVTDNSHLDERTHHYHHLVIDSTAMTSTVSSTSSFTQAEPSVSTMKRVE